MKKKKYLSLLLLIMLCCFLFQYVARAQSSVQISISSQGSINYGSVNTQSPSPSPVASPSPQPSLTPTPIPTPTTTQTPTPTPISGVNNMALINDGKWFTDAPGSWLTCPVKNVFYDASTTYQGDLTWRVEPANSVTPSPSWGPDHSLIAISPGENIVMECWVKTSGSAGAYGTGARIGFDYYGTLNGQLSRICGISSPDEGGKGEGWPNYSSPQDESPTYTIPWGTGWTLIYWSFTVPSQAEGDSSTVGLNQISTNQWCAISGCIPWCQVWGAQGDGSSTYTSWFSDFQFYINP